MKPKYLRIISVAFIIAGGILLILSKTIPYVPTNFSYSAKIFSIDNFYDEMKQEYAGAEFSNTEFIYTVTTINEEVAIISNSFSVNTLIGEPIFSVNRIYGIDPATGAHKTNYGDKSRTGFLFAPKNLKIGQSFTYWHVNYDEPAHMEYIDAINVNGLTIYKYEANYHADQTNDLTHLSGVPDKRGVNLDINLTLWIEPVTGWLLKYSDLTTAYYFDIETKKRIHPWNTFSNTYQDVSFNDHIKLAKQRKDKYHALRYGGLTILTLSAIMIIANWRKSNRTRGTPNA